MTLLASVYSAATAGEGTAEACPPTAARIVVRHSGAVTLNGQGVALQALGAALGSTQPPPSEVCFAQETPNDQSAELGSIIEGLIFLRMRVSIYSGPDFLQRVGVIGERTPR